MLSIGLKDDDMIYDYCIFKDHYISFLIIIMHDHSYGWRCASSTW